MAVTLNNLATGTPIGTIYDVSPGTWYIVTDAAADMQVNTRNGWRKLPVSQTILWRAESPYNQIADNGGSADLYLDMELIK